jgi:hypothetical protein
METLFGTLSVVLLVMVVALGIATSVVSNRFFKLLKLHHPELKDAFPDRPRFVFGHASQPLPESRMDYLKGRRYEDVAEPTVRALGRRSWRLLLAYAITFAALVISLLVWNYLRSNAP